MFTKKQMQTKATHWINQMNRARQGAKLKNDSIPAGLEEAQDLARGIFDHRDAEILCAALDLAFKEEATEPGEAPKAPPGVEIGPPPAGVAQLCAECDAWAEMGSKTKGKMIPGGPGKCTREGGLCENHVPKDPHPGRIS